MASPGGQCAFFAVQRKLLVYKYLNSSFLKHPERSAGEQAHFSIKPNKGCLKHLQKKRFLLERLGLHVLISSTKTQIWFGINLFTDIHPECVRCRAF